MAQPNAPLAKPWGVEWWYRHESDPDQSIRSLCQMSSAVASHDEIVAEVASLQRQGYIVQRILVQAGCPRCQTNGRIIVRVYKRKPAKYAECPTCRGNGYLGEPLEFPVPPHETVGV